MEACGSSSGSPSSIVSVYSCGRMSYQLMQTCQVRIADCGEVKDKKAKKKDKKDKKDKKKDKKKHKKHKRYSQLCAHLMLRTSTAHKLSICMIALWLGLGPDLIRPTRPTLTLQMSTITRSIKKRKSTSTRSTSAMTNSQSIVKPGMRLTDCINISSI